MNRCVSCFICNDELFDCTGCGVSNCPFKEINMPQIPKKKMPKQITMPETIMDQFKVYHDKMRDLLIDYTVDPELLEDFEKLHKGTVDNINNLLLEDSKK